MEQAKSVIITLIPEEEKEIYGSIEFIEQYLKEGYKIKKNKYNHWILKKDLKVIMIATISTGVYSFDIKEFIIKYNKNKIITNEVVDEFETQILDNKFIIKINKNGHDFSIETRDVP